MMSDERLGTNGSPHDVNSDFTQDLGLSVLFWRWKQQSTGLSHAVFLSNGRTLSRATNARLR